MIKTISLKNFKCFEKQDFDLGNLTLLTGLNGAGKSSVIQSILSIRQSYERNILKDTGLSLNGDFVRLGKAYDVLFEDAPDEIISIGMVTDKNQSARWEFEYQKDTDVLKLAKSSLIDKEVFNEALFDDRFQYLAAERIGPRVIYNTSDFFVGQHKRIGIKGEFAPQFLALYGDEEVKIKGLLHSNSRNNQLRGQLEAWLSEVTPGTRIHTTQHQGMDLINLEFSFAHGANVTKQFRSTNVGFGITYTLPVLMAVLASNPGDFIIIENPEAHLHPKGQRKLGELLAIAASGGVQILVESHSDHLLNGIRIAVYEKRASAKDIKVHFFASNRKLDSKMTSVVSPEIDDKGRLNNWPEDFFDEWDKSLEKLLT